MVFCDLTSLSQITFHFGWLVSAHNVFIRNNLFSFSSTKNLLHSCNKSSLYFSFYGVYAFSTLFLFSEEKFMFCFSYIQLSFSQTNLEQREGKSHSTQLGQTTELHEVASKALSQLNRSSETKWNFTWLKQWMGFARDDKELLRV